MVETGKSGRLIPLSSMARGKHGMLLPPILKAFQGGLKLTTSSWAQEQLPEYLWFGTIISQIGPKKTAMWVQNFCKEIRDAEIQLASLRFSDILRLKIDEQLVVFNCIAKTEVTDFLDFSAFLALSIRDDSNYDGLRKAWTIKDTNFDQLSKKISNLSEKFYDQEDEPATFIRLNEIYLMGVLGKLHVSSGSMMIELFKQYHPGDFSYNINPMLGSLVRASEVAMGATREEEFFNKDFYRFTAEHLPCNPKMLSESNMEHLNNFKDASERYRSILDENIHQRKRELVQSVKYQVFVATCNYARTLFDEFGQIGFDSVSSRLSLRTVLEAYVNLEFMVNNESAHPEIWSDFQEYGESAFRKLAGEIDQHSNESERLPSEFDSRIINILSQEHKAERYGEIDFKYFANKKIKDKFKLTGHENLYQTYYEFGTAFSHAYWGAIRLSATYFCDEPLHGNHVSVEPNIKNEQYSTLDDYVYIMDKLIFLFQKTFPNLEV